MAKLIGLFVRREGTTPEQFREHYEQVHAPLIMGHYGDLFTSYTRNFSEHGHALLGGFEVLGGGRRYDVATEICFANEADLAEMFRRSNELPGVADEVAADEGSFMDVEKRQLFVVTETGFSPI